VKYWKIIADNLSKVGLRISRTIAQFVVCGLNHALVAIA
jgi:hypothetical protein